MEDQETYCIYHSKDWDGVMSGAVVKSKFPNTILIGWDYGERSPIEQIRPKSRVFVVDLCLTIEDMLMLHDKCTLYWCDHHRTQLDIKELKHIRGNRGLNAAGCMLTYEFLFDYKPYPKGLNLLSRYDIWDHTDLEDWDNKILPFQMGMRQYSLNPEHDVLTKILDNDRNFVQDTINQGFGIMQYEKVQAANYMKLYSFTVNWNFLGKKHKVLVVNRQGINSIFFESVFDKSKHDMMVSYTFNGSKTKYTIWSPKNGVDVGMIAKALGGGGHRNAAGFETKGNTCIFQSL